MRPILLAILSLCLLISTSCGDGEGSDAPKISILSSSINGSNTAGMNTDVAIDVTIELVFSSALNPASFESLFSIASNGIKSTYTVSYANASSKAIATATLDHNTTYTVSVGTNPIGARGEKLAQPIAFTFTTAEDDVIRSAAPCVSVGSCLRSVELDGSQGKGTFEFYSNYDIYEENAEWENLTHAIFVVHGASHDPNNYYTYLTNTLQAEGLSESTILIAPYFRNSSTGSADDFYWANTDWRRGSPSTNSNKLSSFEAIDLIINQLANTDRFPVLEKIIITGHSSGAAFSHVFAGANKSENTHTTLDFEYVVANSQFFYYPDGQRINESTNQLFTPIGCALYDVWPLGYNSTPIYLSGVNSASFNSQFVNRSVTYLLGNGTQADGTLNTTDCENTLQGSSRYLRGENMFRYMELVYPSTHNHTKTIVNGIGHDGSGMYQSSEFKTLLNQLLQ